jgi:hypothetical protein
MDLDIMWRQFARFRPMLDEQFAAWQAQQAQREAAQREAEQDAEREAEQAPADDAPSTHPHFERGC